jgi:plastocyanin
VKLRPVTASLVALTAVAVPVAGCGGGSNPGQSSAKSGGSSQPSKPSGSSQPSQAGGSSSSKSGGSSSSKSGGSAAKSSGGSVTIANFKFAPASLTVSKGAQVSVANHDSTAHTFTADNGKSFNTGDINPNASATVTVSKPGTYKYHCSIHPFMHGTLVVK